MTSIQIVGNLAADPELRFTAAGKPVVNFTVMASTRRLNKETNEWEDVDVTAWLVTAFDKLAENVANSLMKGDAAIVLGEANTRSWETKEGEKRSRVEVVARKVGMSLERHSAKSSRASAPRPKQALEPDPWASAETPF